MADTVQLNEITSIKGDAQNAYGGVAGGNDALLPFSQAIPLITSAAKAKSESNAFKYLQFQQNLKEYYKNFDEIKVDGLMEKDYPVITQQYAQLSKDIAANYDVIRNPMKNPEKYEELKGREAELRATIARSKQDVAFRTAHQGFLQSHPEFNTPDNQKILDDFSKGELGQRTTFTLTTPFTYDPGARAKAANAVAQQKLTEQKSQGRYLVKEDALQYLETEYDAAWDALGATQDKSGRTVTQIAADAYGKLDPTITAGQDFATIDRKIGRSLMYQDEFVKTLVEDPVQAQEDAQKHDANENAKNRALSRELNTDKDLVAVGRDYNEALTSGFTTGYVRPQLLQGLFGDNSDVELKNKEQVEVLDADGKGTGIFNPTGKETVVKVPKIQVTGSSLVDGKIVVKRVDNSSGKPVAIADVVMTFEEAREAFKNIAGANNAGKVADAAEKYRKINKLGTNPELGSMQKHFNFGATSNSGL